MRIIAGNLKGQTILNTPDKETRPPKDIVRQGIFNVLEHSKKLNFNLKDSNILDLYSGTGSFGFEALSRGAKKVVFVEKNSNTQKILLNNINKLDVTSQIENYALSVEKFFKKKINIKFDLIFCDPPFKDQNIELVIEMLNKGLFINKKNVFVIHRHRKNTEKYPLSFKILDQKNYGNSKIIFGTC